MKITTSNLHSIAVALPFSKFQTRHFRVGSLFVSKLHLFLNFEACA